MQKYDSYKSSGIEWIGEIPSHWEIKTLQKIKIKFSAGKREQTELKEIISIGGEHIQKGTFFLDNPKYVSFSFYNLARHGKIKIHDILLVKDGATIGKALFVKNMPFENMLINEHVYRIEASKFFYYVIISNQSQFYFWKNNQSSAQESINSDTLKSLLIALPPLAEQEAIAVYLDRKTAEIDSLISDKKQLLALYEAEKTAIINNAVTKGIKAGVAMRDSGVEWLGEIPSHWGVKKLKYVAELNPSKKSSYKDSNEPVVFLPMEKVNADGTINCEIKKPAVELWNGFTYFERNDIIIAKITPCFENGKGAWLNNLETEIGFGSTEFHVLRAKSILQNYLYYITRCYDFMVIGEASMTGSAGQKRVPTEFIKEFQYAIPPLLEQAEIVSYIEGEVSRIAAKVSNVNRLISLLEEYRSALISEVVTGKVRVV
jgi:type I restriction enzyme, S subunit